MGHRAARAASKPGLFCLEAIVVLVAGDAMFHFVATLPFDMPFGVERAVGGVLHALGRDDLMNPDDMETIVGLAVLIVTTAITAALVWGIHALLMHRIRRSSRPRK